MDEAERIPIDIGYEVAGEAAVQPSDLRTSVRDNGTVVIDILAPQPCAPEPSTGNDILVCAQAPEAGQLRPLPPPPAPSPMDVLAEALSPTIGPVAINPGLRPEGTVGIGLRIRF